MFFQENTVTDTQAKSTSNNLFISDNRVVILDTH